jgi:hypothetical protein
MTKRALELENARLRGQIEILERELCAARTMHVAPWQPNAPALIPPVWPVSSPDTTGFPPPPWPVTYGATPHIDTVWNHPARAVGRVTT